MRRLISGAIAVLLAAGAAYGASTLGEPQAGVVDAAAVQVPAGQVTSACVGSARLATSSEDLSGQGSTSAPDASYDPAFDPTPQGSTSSQVMTSLSNALTNPDAPTAGVPSSVTTSSGSAGSANATAPVTQAGKGVVALASTANSSLWLTAQAPPSGNVPATLVGVSTTVTSAGDLQGLATAACQRPSTDAWLVGGSTAVGSSARLVLLNPMSSPSTVSLTVYGPSGPVPLGTGQRVVVPAQSEVVVLLEGIAPEQKRIAVRVQSTGEGVSAFIQDSLLMGLTPGGVDYVEPSIAPTTSLEIPALAVEASDADSEQASVLRVVVPGDAGGLEANAEITLTGPDGVVDFKGLSPRTLGAGTVTDLSLAGLPSGSYTAHITSDRPLTAAAMVTRVGTVPKGASYDSPPVERAWVAAQAPTTTASFAVPQGVRSRLLLQADQPSTVSVTLVMASGESVKIDAISLAENEQTLLELSKSTPAGQTLVAVVSSAEVAPDAGAVGTVTPFFGNLVVTAPISSGTGISILSSTPAAPNTGEVGVRIGEGVGIAGVG